MACKPRVIAAQIKKDLPQDVALEKPPSKSRIAGVISLICGTSAEPHYAEVRDGQLLLYPGASPRTPPIWRLSLRHLHLQPAASGRPRGFSLTRHGEGTPIATFQADSEGEFIRWVRTIAAELLKQTPLEAVKYLDILGITTSLPHVARESRSLSPECTQPASLSSEEPLSWDRRFSPPSRSWPPTPLAQPLSLVITEEPRRHPLKKSAAFENSAEDLVDGRYHVRMVDSICQLAKQSKNCFRSCARNNFTPPELNVSGKSRVKSLLKTFITQDSTSTSPSSLYTLDIKDDGRTRRPPLPDVVKDLPPCDRKSRPRTRSSVITRFRGKSVDVLPSSEDSRVAELIAHCRQEDRYIPVKEKRLLFESLGRATSQPRFVFSSDNLASLADLSPEPAQPRAQSLHDLSRTNVAVKEICRYFEQRNGLRSPSPECRRSMDYGSPRNLRAEKDTILWRYRDQVSTLPPGIRGGDFLQDDRKSLRSDSARFQKPGQFGILRPTVRHLSDVR